jgi:hypothetical protein
MRFIEKFTVARRARQGLQMVSRYIKSILAETPVYDGWAALQAFRQKRQFDRIMLAVHVATSMEGASLVDALAVRRRDRRAISSRPRVFALGHEAWEEYGLWPSFRRLADFHLYPMGLVNGAWNSSLCVAEMQRILATVDEMDREAPVEMVFIYVDSSFLDPEMLRGLADRGIWTVLMGLDDKHKLAARIENGMLVGQERIAPLVDVYWTTWKSALPYLRKIGARPFYLAEGADPAFHHPMELERDIDVLFLGARYGIREKLVSYLQRQGFDVTAYGKGWAGGYVSFEESIELVNRSKVVLGIGGVGHLDGVQHLKGRDFEVPMCGAVYLTTYNPELTDWYSVGKDILCYSSPQNCAETLDWLLRDPDAQARIRAAALSRARRDHTWEKRLNALLGVFKKEGADE